MPMVRFPNHFSIPNAYADRLLKELPDLLLNLHASVQSLLLLEWFPTAIALLERFSTAIASVQSPIVGAVFNSDCIVGLVSNHDF